MQEKITVQIEDEEEPVTLTRKQWLTARARISNALRTNRRGPARSDAPRCPCGENTLTRARLRSFICCRDNRISAAKIDQAKNSL